MRTMTESEQRCGECRWFKLILMKNEFGNCEHPVTKLRPMPQVLMASVVFAEYGTQCKCFERKEKTK